MGDASVKISDKARDELVSEAVDVKVERDRLRHQLRELQRLLDEPDVVGGPHDVMLWRVWHQKATETAAALDRCGTALAHADRALRAVLANPDAPATSKALLDYKRARIDLERGR
jgi:hypothetical protein